MSFAGTNNRYNAFRIDGAMNNDMFGLTANGSNGGQAGAQPVSMETVEQIRINVAPFDVRRADSPAAPSTPSPRVVPTSSTDRPISTATTRSWWAATTTARWQVCRSLFRRERVDVWLHPRRSDPEEQTLLLRQLRTLLQVLSQRVRTGNARLKVDADKATSILNAIKDLAQRQGINYNGQYDSSDSDTWSNKAGFKIDWNINDFNKFMVRWSYVNASTLNGRGGISTLNTIDHLYRFKSNTNTVTAELQSRLSPVLSNEARLSYVGVRDKRTSGAAFPSITIKNVGNGTVNIGNEYSSMANGLDQDVRTLEDNLTWYKGNHTLTFGTHNELYSFDNLFIRESLRKLQLPECRRLLHLLQRRPGRHGHVHRQQGPSQPHRHAHQHLQLRARQRRRHGRPAMELRLLGRTDRLLRTGQVERQPQLPADLRHALRHPALLRHADGEHSLQRVGSGQWL